VGIEVSHGKFLKAERRTSNIERRTFNDRISQSLPAFPILCVLGVLCGFSVFFFEAFATFA